VIDDNKPFPFTDILTHAFRYWERLYGDLGYIEGHYLEGKI
jgi:hypothetical protein